MNDDDIQHFRKSIGVTHKDFHRLKAADKEPPAHTPPKIKLRSHLPTQQTVTAPFSDHDPYSPHGAPPENQPTYERTEFQRASLSRETLRRLRQGKHRIESTLDLHGCTVDEARQNLYQHLQQPSSGRYPSEARCIRIIHGQGYHSPHGQGKLKRLICIWLPQSEHVLAFCTARPGDGGHGAMYVLLRANRLA
jgi:DNA-nicking Smr family endonuclease